MAEKTLLDQIKLFIGVQDAVQDELLTLIIDDSTQRILSYVNRNREEEEAIQTLPTSVDYIIRDVSIKRFNKINSEGTVADSEEGRSYTWEPSYLSEYTEVLDALNNKGYGGRGIARFIP